MDSLDIIIPYYNEANTLPLFLERIKNLVLPIPFNLIFVDDGSTDGSGEIISRFKLMYPATSLRIERNSGKGRAIQLALTVAKAKYCIIQDADTEYNPFEIAKLLVPLLLGEAEAVFGCRRAYLFGASGPIIHRLANRFLTKFFNVVHHSQLTDMETCYKILSLSDMRALRLRSPRFGVEPEIAAGLVSLNRRIAEVPISYVPRTRHQGKKIKFEDGLAAIFHILRFRFF